MKSWHFTEIRPGYKQRESQIEKFFASDVVADNPTGLIREGIQNSLDARDPQHDGPIRVCIGVYSATSSRTPPCLPSYMKGFESHFKASQPKMRLPFSDGDLRYLVFEDFGTSGVLGDPTQWMEIEGVDNPFYNYFHGEGLSGKQKGSRGRHGVGKHEFSRASDIRAVFALTRRIEPDGSKRDLLMGTAVLRTHQISATSFLPDGWFGIPSGETPGHVLPIDEDAYISTFKTDFKLTRTTETGLSIVVPQLNVSVDANTIVQAVITGFFHPILSGELVVSVRDVFKETLITGETIAQVAEAAGGTFASNMSPLLDLARAALRVEDWQDLSLPPDADSPKWGRACISDAVRDLIQTQLENLEVVKLRVPVRVRENLSANKEQQHDSEFKVVLRRDASSDDGQIIFIRMGLIISDVRSNDRQVRCPGVRALVIIENGALAQLLGDSENPAHTQWQYQLVKDKYIKAGVCINYVASSAPSILRLLSDEQKKADPSLLIDLFSLPSESDVGPKTRQKRKKPGGQNEAPPLSALSTKLKRFRVQKLEDGFVIRRGDAAAPLPPAIELKVAYDVCRGNALAKYRPPDFRLGLGAIHCAYAGCEHTEFGDNWLIVKINQPDFEIRVTGFDTRRDLHVDAKVKEQEGETDGSSD